MDLPYLKQREQAERVAAENAACPQARLVHQEMAQRYADLLRSDADRAWATIHD